MGVRIGRMRERPPAERFFGAICDEVQALEGPDQMAFATAVLHGGEWDELPAGAQAAVTNLLQFAIDQARKR